MYYLYLITNGKNGKVYVGQTINPNKRWNDHKRLALKKPLQYIHRAMAKYGIEDFTYEVIAVCKTQEDANETETTLIKQYDSRNKKKGYNLASGGSNGTHTEDSIKKMKQIKREWHQKRKELGASYTHRIDYDKIIDLYCQDIKVSEIALQMDCYPSEIYRIVKRANIPLRGYLSKNHTSKAGQFGKGHIPSNKKVK